jgi:steroid delta-isomerase-like uncharacterized protein
MTEDTARLARTVYEAFNRNDLDAALALAQPDIEIVNLAENTTFRGHDGFRDYLKRIKEIDPAGWIEVISQLVCDAGVTNECVYHATHVGPLHGIEPTGKPFTAPLCDVWRVRDGKIASIHTYADNMTVLAQLGLLPQPAST